MSVVIADGFADHTILDVVRGKKVGTFFTAAKATGTPLEEQAGNGREQRLNTTGILQGCYLYFNNILVLPSCQVRKLLLSFSLSVFL